MAEIKITCPNCLNDSQCFEEDLNQIENFKSYMCFNCGFTSNSSFTENSNTLKELLSKSTQLVRDVSLFDYDIFIIIFLLFNLISRLKMN